MRGTFGIRVLVAAVIIGLTYLGMKAVTWGIQLPEVVPPPWNVNELPKQLGPWKGADEKLDERLTQATGAHAIVERRYINSETQTAISLHLAIFTDPTTGIWHNPMTCYKANGWKCAESARVPFSQSDEKSDKLALSVWEKGGDRNVVGYWYQLGELRLYDRWDLGWKARWQLRGRQTWPALIKVLLSSDPGSKTDEAKAQMTTFAILVHDWINQPQHQTEGKPAESEPVAAK
jgi:EpsI family protein